MKRIQALWWVFFSEIALFLLIITGTVPREFAWVLAILLVGYAACASLEDGVALFVMSIPLFIAIPMTVSFDNFNTWRIVAVVLFLRWLAMADTRTMLVVAWREIRRRPRLWVRHNVSVALLATFVLLSVLSLVGASDIGAGIKRIIYFANLAMVPIVLASLIRRDSQYSSRIIQAIAIPTGIVIFVGCLQIISTYFMDIYQFMRLWGEEIQFRQFGDEWSQIVVRLGNTWFAYYGEQLSLRVFSLFPDSHSFPQFVLLGLPALFALISRGKWLKRLGGVMAVLGLLLAILSGTRGIWAACLGVIGLSGILWLFMWKWQVLLETRRVFHRVCASLGIFLILFAVAWPIFTSPQFLLSKGDWRMMRNRIKSIIDFGETSNSQRIDIWKKSIVSIAHHPALVVMVILIVMLMRNTYCVFLASRGPDAAYYGGLLLMIPWILIYSLTDVAIFDERAFLMFLTAIALIAGKSSNIAKVYA